MIKHKMNNGDIVVELACDLCTHSILDILDAECLFTDGKDGAEISAVIGHNRCTWKWQGTSEGENYGNNISLREYLGRIK